MGTDLVIAGTIGQRPSWHDGQKVLPAFDAVDACCRKLMDHLSPAQADSDADGYQQQSAKHTSSDLDCLNAGNAGDWLTPLCYSPWTRPPRG